MIRNQTSLPLPVWLVEPSLEKKRRQAARRLFKTTRFAEFILSQSEGLITSLEDIKRRLKEIREYARNNHRSLLEELKNNLSHYDKVKVTTANNIEKAINYIKGVTEEINPVRSNPESIRDAPDLRRGTSNGVKFISVNKSGVITNELKPDLESQGFKVIDSYYNEFQDFQEKIADYWQLPRLHEKGIIGSFDPHECLLPTAQCRLKNYLALLGVNAISSDGTIFFLQHFSNIQKDLLKARKLILVVPLDKIVNSREDAEFQTQCMGIFGMESMLLDLGSNKKTATFKIDNLPDLSGEKDREIHIMFLDNGRSHLLQNSYKDLFLCIGCRACVRQCPINTLMKSDESVWSCKNYLWKFLLEKEFVPEGPPTRSGRRAFTPELDKCLHCESCRAECPLEIPLPHLMWQAQTDYVTKHGRPLKKILVGNPELWAKMGTFFVPFSNIALNIPLARTLMEKVTGFHRRSSLPPFASNLFGETFRNRFVPLSPVRSNPESIRDAPDLRRGTSNGVNSMLYAPGSKVAYYTGCFANYYDPEVAESTVELLRKSGCEVIIPSQKCCGMPMMANDNFQGAKDNAIYNVKSLAEVVRKGYDIVTACPSCSLMIKQEYLDLLDSDEARLVSEHLWYISDYPPLRRIADEAISRLGKVGAIHELPLQPRKTPTNIFYHTPCHLRNQGIPEASIKLIESIPGISIKGINTACCGMGGTYGFKKEHYEVSKQIGNKVFEDVKQFVGAGLPRPYIVTDCGMCKVQIEDSTGAKVVHPMVLLREAYSEVGRKQ